MTILQLFVDSVLLGGTYLLLAVGLNLIFGVMRLVNFAHGGMMVFAGLFAFWLATTEHLSVLLSVVVAVAAVAAIGYASDVLALERIRAEGQQAELLSLLMTYGISIVIINASSRLFGTRYESLPSLQGAWNVGALSFARSESVGAVVGVVCSVLVLFWLRYTRSGKQVAATAQSVVGAQVCGVNAVAVRRVAFTLGAALAGLAGALLIFQNSMSPDSGLGFTILAFVMIAVGGPGNYVGGAIGSLALALVTTYTGYYSGATLSGLAPYCLLLIVLLVRFRGRKSFA